MTETASFTAVAHFGQPAASSITTTNRAGFQGKTLLGAAATTAGAGTTNTKTTTTGSSSISGGPSLSFHSHRQNHNSSKLPSFRFADIKNSNAAVAAPKQAPLPLSPRQPAPPLLTSPSNTADPLTTTLPTYCPDAIAQGDRPTQPLTATTTGGSPTESISPQTAASHRLSTYNQDENSPSWRNLRTRSSSYQYNVLKSSSVTDQDRKVRRPASFPDSLVEEAAQSTELTRTSSLRQSSRRPPAFRSSNGVTTARGPPLSLNTRRLGLEVAASNAQSAAENNTASAQERPNGQRDLLVSKTLSPSSQPDENRDPSSQRPPVSHNPPVSSGNSNNTGQSDTASPTVRVPPIRSFRSSGSRKSLVAADMNFQSRPYEMGDRDRYSSESAHDRTLRSFDVGKSGQTTPPTSMQHMPGNDDTGDVFMKIASEESSRRATGDSSGDDARNAFRANRSSHRRPFSTVVTSYNQSSPPRVNRRLSDQEGRSRSIRYDDDLASEITRSVTYRPTLREKAASAHPGEDVTVRIGASTLRPSPMVPRSLGQEQAMDNANYARRRPSVVESSNSAARSPAAKPPVLAQGQNKTYQPSPLTRSFDIQNHHAPETSNTVEGTESTASTNAPSTVWDELDDLKSRIHRLELTGKLPPTSGAAVIKSTEERPPTATTTVTTMSLSPKKSANGQQADVVNSTLSQRESHPHLHSALAKTKAFLSPEVYRALETAANDALALASLMGIPGQPGPISSAASVVGTGHAVTDRQLRRRADSVCRSLTELCIALGEGNPRPPTIPTTQSTVVASIEGPATPTTVTKTQPVSRRPSISNDQTLQVTSPRAMSKFEERRNMILSGSTLPSPRHTTSTPATPNDSAAARRSSLIVPRTRRAGTEEPEDGRRSSIFLRSRRAGTEEPDEGRKTSLLVRGRRGTVGEDSEDAKIRSPSRAITEVNGIRGSREYPQVADAQPPRPDANLQPSSALNRRRFVSSNLHSSRLTTPLPPNVTPTRKYLERPSHDVETNAGEKLNETRFSRHLPPGQSSLLNRTGNLQVRRANRDSMIASASSTAAADGLR